MTIDLNSKEELLFPTTHSKFSYGDLVCKTRGAEWHGRVVGWYSTELTHEGYAVESFYARGSVQIYPAAALVPWVTKGK